MRKPRKPIQGQGDLFGIVAGSPPATSAEECPECHGRGQQCDLCAPIGKAAPAPEHKRCPHDGGYCHGTGYCESTGLCYREEGGMALTTPHEGYPLPGHEQAPFDVEASEKARDMGIARVEASTEEWQTEALEVIRSVAREQRTLTTDDIWRELGRDADLEGRAMGAAMRMAAKLGYVRRTDLTRKSERVACHRRDLRVWESLLSPRSPAAP